MQIDADVKLLTDFLSLLRSDAVQGAHSVTSLSPLVSNSRSHGRWARSGTSCPLIDLCPLDYVTRLKSVNRLLRLLVENEIYRLKVWANPANDAKRVPDHVTSVERDMLDVSVQIAEPFILTIFVAGLLGQRGPHGLEDRSGHSRSFD